MVLIKRENIRYLALIFILSFLFLIFSQTILAHTISGVVYTKQRVPLEQVNVELYNDLYQMKGRTKTDATGRYSFTGVTDGNYSIKVLPLRYSYKGQTKSIQVGAVHASGRQVAGNSFFTLDFYLSPKKGILANSENRVIFSQEVPDDAKSNFENGVKDLSANNKEEGIKKLKKAIEIFPDYYQALTNLGKELVKQGKFVEAAPLFIKAVKVNPKSADALFYKGYCLSKFGKKHNKDAMEALTQASVLAPDSVQVLYVLGKVERKGGKFSLAEKHLLKAKKLSDTPVPEIHKELAQLYGNDLKDFGKAARELELYMKSSKMSKEDKKNIKQIISRLKKKAKSE